MKVARTVWKGGKTRESPTYPYLSNPLDLDKRIQAITAALVYTLRSSGAKDEPVQSQQQTDGVLTLGRVDICKTICNRRGEFSSPINQRGLEPLNHTG